MKKTVRHLSLLSTILLIAILSASCSVLPSARTQVQPEAESEAEPTPIPTPIVPQKPVYTVEQGDVVRRLQVTGRVVPVTEEELFFRTNGRIKNVNVKRGDDVTAGQVLAELEMPELERQLQAAQLELNRTKAQIAKAEIGLASQVKRAQIDLASAQTNLALVKSQNPAPQQKQAEAALAQAKTALDWAQGQYNDIAYRNDAGASPQAAALQQATFEYDKAKAAYDAAMQDIAGYKYRVQLQEQQVQLAQLALDSLQQGVDPMLQSDVDRADLEVKRVQAEIADAQIIAPFDGQVMSIVLTPGRAAEAFKAVATVAVPGEREISAELKTEEMQEVTEGMGAQVAPVSSPGEVFGATIRRLPYPYGGGGGSAQVEDEDKSTRFTPDDIASLNGYDLGDLMKITIILEEKKDALWLPPAAIRNFEGRNFVVIQDGDAQRRQDVKLGIKNEDQVEILEGLEKGQTIVGR
jgi:multidrug efflux pump subunit AcrA (membrane-fusion protein)